ncbi:penicillin-binding protein activator [Candidatus Kaiserbacteria bacterium]|nr:penicillin-binding protein activator [Candidatus Kaiserbacteria bacterium]
MSIKTKWIIATTVIILIILGFIFYLNNKSTVDGNIRIGAIFILSGDAAGWGENAKKGFDLAVKDFKETYDIGVETIIEDSQGDPKTAISVFQKLITLDKVDGVVGPLFQAEVAAVASNIASANIPVITPSYAPIINRDNPRNPLMVWMDPSLEAYKIAEYVFDQGVRTVAVFGTHDSWENEVSDSFASRFKELGGIISTKELTQTDDTDVRVPIIKIINTKPEAVFLGTYYQFIHATKVLNEFGYEGKLYSIEVDSYLATEAKDYIEGLEFITPESYSNNFIEKFEREYGIKPGIPAGQAYDATILLLDLLRQEGPREKIIKTMENLESYEGVSGAIEWTKDNRTILPTAIFKIQDGEFIK